MVSRSAAFAGAHPPVARLADVPVALERGLDDLGAEGARGGEAPPSAASERAAWRACSTTCGATRAAAAAEPPGGTVPAAVVIGRASL